MTRKPLTHDEVREIALMYIAQVTATLKRWNKSLTVEPAALEKIVTDEYVKSRPVYDDLRKWIKGVTRTFFDQALKEASRSEPRLLRSTSSQVVPAVFKCKPAPVSRIAFRIMG